MSNYTFLALEEDPKSAQVVFIPAPYDATVSYKPGTREGPRRIIEASRYLEFYDEETKSELYLNKGFLTLSEPELPVEPQKALKCLEELIRPYINQGLFPVLLGGEHTVTLALVKILKDYYPDLCVLQIDAHADLRFNYQGSLLSHACVMRRIFELGVEILPVGIRSISKEEIDFAIKNGIRIYFAKEVIRNPRAVAEEIITQANGRPLYVSIDLDGLDPSEVPGVGTPEPGGLRWYELLDILRLIATSTKVVGFDVVELLPLPHEHRSEFLAARLVYKFLSYLFS